MQLLELTDDWLLKRAGTHGNIAIHDTMESTRLSLKISPPKKIEMEKYTSA